MKLNLAEDAVYADPVRKIQEQLYSQLIAVREGMHQTITTAIAEVNVNAAPAQINQAPAA